MTANKVLVGDSLDSLHNHCCVTARRPLCTMDNSKDSDVFLDNEEAHHPLTLTLPTKKKKATSSSFTDRTNKLLHYLVGITICGAILVFFPS